MKRMLVRRFRRNRRTTARAWRMLLIALSVLGIFGAMFFSCQPIMLTYSESQAVWIATKIANQTAAQVLQQYEVLCANAITVTYDQQQQVSSIQTAVTTVNAVRTDITCKVMEAIERSSSISVSIPLGTLLGCHWFSGLGPMLTFPISFTATVNSSVSSSLTAEGINQSAYRILLFLDIALYIVTPGGRTTTSTTVNFPVVETVILGEVPDNLTEVYGDDQSLLGQIFDYGTVQ